MSQLPNPYRYAPSSSIASSRGVHPMTRLHLGSGGSAACAHGAIV